MPVFSKMMSSYPFQMIKGLHMSPNMKMAATRMGVGAAVGAGVGGAMDRRNGGMTRGAIGGAIAGGLTATGSIYGSGIKKMGQNLMRPGVGGMYGNLLRGKGEMATASAMHRMSGWAAKASTRMAR